MRFADRVVIVTGGGQGIGRAVAQAFAAEGAAVVLADVDAEAGVECEALIRTGGGRALFVETDVADERDVERLVARTVDAFGGVDVLINTAGIGGQRGLEAPDAVAFFDRVLAVNLRGAFLCARACAPEMRRRGGGAVVNIASTRALMSEPHSEAYAASKGGLLALTHALAVSLGVWGIRVNAVSPGWIEVRDWQKASARRDPDLRPVDHAQHPAGRVGRPADVARACLFLASPDEAGFITGQNLILDGGMTVKMIYAE